MGSMGNSNAPPKRESRVYFYRGLAREHPPKRMREYIVKTAKDRTSSFHVTDLQTLIAKAEHWREHLSWIEPHYAVKSNNSPTILECLNEQDVRFDVASKAEMDLLGKIGVSASRLVYSNPCKSESDLRYAKRLGISLSVFDAESEVRKIRETQGEGAAVLMRIKVEDAGAQVKFSHRFGAGRQMWRPLLKLCKELGLKVRGVSFHIGSGIIGQKGAFALALTEAKKAIDVERELGFDPDVVNIGGGFGAEEDLAKTAERISPHRDHFSDMRWLAEPGRYFSALSQTAAARVLVVKPGQITVNDGIYGTFSCIPFDHTGILKKTDVPVTQDGDQIENVAPFQVFGPSCDGHDTIAEKLPVPRDIQVGDWLVFAGMGAYTQASAMAFNGIPTSEEFTLDSLEKQADLTAAGEQASGGPQQCKA